MNTAIFTRCSNFLFFAQVWPPTGSRPRAPTLRLHRTRLDNGPLVIAVLVPGPTPGDP